MSPVKLFNLPFIPLSMILNSMTFEELLKVALTSKKSFRTGRFLTMRNKNKKVKLIMNIGRIVALDYLTTRYFHLFHVHELSEIQKASVIEYLKIGDTVFGIQKDEKDESIHFYSNKDKLTGLEIITEFVSDFLDLPIDDLNVYGEMGNGDSRRIINWVMRRQKSIQNCFLESKEMSEEDLKYFLDTAKITKRFSLSVETSKDFRYFFKYPLETGYLHLSNESWMTIQNLMEVDCGSLFMPKSRLTNEEVNLFLNHWMNGGNPKLRRIFLRLKHFDLDIILNGIEGKWRKNHGSISYNSFDGTECKLPSSSFEIQRNDGTIASIVSPELFERRGFYLFIWPDYKGLPYPLDTNHNE